MIADSELFNSGLIYSQHGLPRANPFCRFTSFLRIKPDLFIIGAQKAGTTSLASYLSGFPQIIPPKQKEISYFNNDGRFALGEKWYKSFFATSFIKNQREHKTKQKSFTYDATANYFEEIKSASRIKNFNSKAKVIVILRNPIHRAWSHYKMAVKYGFETKSFKEALDLEKVRIHSNKEPHNFAFQRLGYKTKGEYINFLPEWKNCFDKNLGIVLYEELFSNNDVALKNIHAFINLKEEVDLNKLQHLNKGSDDIISREDEEILKNYYSDFNKKLSTYLKRDLPW